MPSEKLLGQSLQTGRYLIIRNGVPAKYLINLKNTSEKLTNIKSRPIYISQEKQLGKTIAERYESAGIKIILGKTAPILQEVIGRKWLILENKVLLRRTWPISEDTARALGHNASNLTWHQDSNHKHQDKPMVVMMISLQNGAGLTRPGLSILESPTDHFEGVFGYEGNRVDEFEKNMHQRYKHLKISNPAINAGDILIFNGLTFHRTYSSNSMNSFRDALLIRAVRPEDANNFPKGQHLIFETT